MYTPNIKIKEEFYNDLKKILERLDPLTIQKNWTYNDIYDSFESIPLIFNKSEMMRTTGIITYDLVHNSLEFNFYIELEHPKGTYRVAFTKSTAMTHFFNDANFKTFFANEIAQDYQRALIFCLDSINSLYESIKSLNLYPKEKYGVII